MFEKDLYPIIQDYLVQNKFCIREYVGNELFMGSDRHMRTDVFGITNYGNEKLIYLLEGKLKLVGRGNFSKVLSESILLTEFADFVYIFGIADESEFKSINSKYFKICESEGIGILLLNSEGEINEILKPERNDIKNYFRKEIIYRIFIKNIQKPIIANFILQSTYEFLKIHNEECAQFIEIYNALFSDKEYKNILKKVIGNKHSLSMLGMRSAFQNAFGNSDMVHIDRMNRPVDDYICLKKKVLTNFSNHLLLDIR